MTEERYYNLTNYNSLTWIYLISIMLSSQELKIKQKIITPDENSDTWWLTQHKILVSAPSTSCKGGTGFHWLHVYIQLGVKKKNILLKGLFEGNSCLYWESLDYEQSLFFRGPSSKTCKTHKWPRPCTLLTKEKKKRDCSQSRESPDGRWKP